MPHVAPDVWFPVVTLILGALLKAVFDYLSDGRTAVREREARKEQRKDAATLKLTEFQRATLLEIQTVAAKLMRFTAQSHHQDVLAFRATGKWQKQLLTEEVNEGFRVSQATLGMLRVRLRDEDACVRAERLSEVCGDAAFAKSEADGDKLLAAANKEFLTLQLRIGEVLRSLDDREDDLIS